MDQLITKFWVFCPTEPKPLADSGAAYGVPRRELAASKQTVYQGQVLTVNQYRWHTPDGDEIEDEALAATWLDYQCDPKAVLVLWIYAARRSFELNLGK